MTRRQSLSIQSPSFDEIPSPTPSSDFPSELSSPVSSRTPTSSSTPVSPRWSPYSRYPMVSPLLRNWKNPIVFFPTSLHSLLMGIMLYSSFQVPYPTNTVFIVYSLLYELYIGHIFLYWTFEADMVHFQQTTSLFVHSILLDGILTVYESLWLLPMNHLVVILSLVVKLLLMFLSTLCVTRTNGIIHWHAVDCIRRACLLGTILVGTLL